ncbi:LysE family translocator [Algirhabdus cladophorae]|uniref:LysE family translocator n=1 Tax=Algirhabdus cladophorae TaxID=3377108 RepID=UPI003B849932
MSDLSWVQIVAFNATLLAALASPGPAFLVATRTALIHGRQAGLKTGLGLATMAAVWTAAALMGLAALFTVIPWLYGALKLGGAVYLLYLAYGMWRGADTPLNVTETAVTHKAFTSGMLVNLANPKSVLFAGAVIAVIFPAGLSVTDSLLIVANHFVIEVVAYAGLAFALSTAPARATFLKAKAVLDRSAAVIMGALGVRLLASHSS